MRCAFKLLFVALTLALSAPSIPAAADTSDPTMEQLDRDAELAVSRGVFDAEQGRWVERSQLTLDGRGHLVRRHYRAWDPHPSLNLEFTWTPREDSDGEVISGEGELVWRLRDIPVYAAAAVYATYDGQVANGRPHGRGVYERHDNLLYRGEWRDGVQHGHGELSLPNGDVYVGPFESGAPSGEGMYIEATGEVFRGRFVAGLREGSGRVTLSDGNVYHSRWRAGRDVDPGTRFAQLGAAATTDVSLRLALDTYDRTRPDVYYRIAEGADRIAIRPGRNLLRGAGARNEFERFMDVWKGEGDIQRVWREEFGDGTVEWDFAGPTNGLFGSARELHPPLGVMLVVQNREAAPVRVVGAYLDVQRSLLDRQPAIELDSPNVDTSCGPPPRAYYADFTLLNYGWGEAENPRLRFAFFRPQPYANGRRPAPDVTPDRELQLQTIEQRLQVDLTETLTSAGVDVDQLIQRDRRGRPIPAEFLGALQSLVPTDGRVAEVGLRGVLEYEWRDESGATHTRTSPFTTYLPLGRGTATVAAECGDGSSQEAIRRTPVELRLSPEPYRVPVALQRTVAAGGTARLFFAISAQQASQHDLAIVIQLADGREIRTRAIDLLYFTPSWFPPTR